MALIKLNSRAIPDNTVIASDIADGSVSTAKLAAGAVSGAKLAADAVTEDKIASTVTFGHRNLLINGDFQEWQRGTSGTVNQYTCDRWFGWGNQHALTQRQAENATHNSGRFALRVAHNDGTANTFSSIAQTLETRDAAQCRGKKVTFSIDVKKGSAFTGNLTLQIVTRTDAEGSINTGTRQVLVTEDITSSLTTSLQRFTCTTSSVCAQNIRVIGVNVNHTGTSGTDANNNFQVERAQLEIGEHATPFETTNASDNLARCQRYYQRTQGTSSGYQNLVVLTNYSTGTDQRGVIPFVTEMRAGPAIGTSGNLMILGAGSGLSSINAGDGITTHMAGLRVNTTSNLSTGQSTLLRGNNDGTAHIKFDAEIS
tara:strand:- start:357 stop:1466 length:1110 start_codon:yes stop_codon:yes gene_type:complete